MKDRGTIDDEERAEFKKRKRTEMENRRMWTRVERRAGGIKHEVKDSRAIQEGNAVAARAQVMTWMVTGHRRPALPFTGFHSHVQIESKGKDIL